MTTVGPNSAAMDDPYMISKGDGVTSNDPGHAHFDVSLNEHMQHNEGGTN